MLKTVKHIIVSLLLIVNFSQAKAQIAMPDSVCIGTTRLYHVNSPATPSTYTWKIDGNLQSSTSYQLSVNWITPGIYLLTVQEHPLNGCDGDIKSGLVYVNAPPIPNAGPDAAICFGSNYQLNASGGSIYKWSPPTYLSSVNVSNPFVVRLLSNITYSLQVTDAFGCISVKSDSVTIKVNPMPVIFAGNDTSIVVNQPLQLNAVDVNNTGISSYAWSPSFGLNNATIKNPTATLSSDITYVVKGRTAAGCEATNDIHIKVYLKPDLFVPNAFTPNGDGLNDVFRPIPVGIKELKYFSIYNRYGQLVYTTTVLNQGWNGVFNGLVQNQGTYVWQAEAIDYQNNIIKKKGVCILIQ